MEKGYSGVWLNSSYGGVEQRWLLVRSEQGSKREQKTLRQQVLKSSKESMKQFKQLCGQAFSCKADAKSTLLDWITE